VPVELGGLGLGAVALAEVASILAQACASTAMVWAMHQIQLACIARHRQGSTLLTGYLREAAYNQLLIASVTSEVGTGGDIRTSIAAIEVEGSDRKRLRKHGSTISYGAYADAFLASARRNVEATVQDQVLVLLRGGDTAIEQTGEWNTLGMRGTCSASFRVSATMHAEQILPTPFAAICSQTMVPYSHVLWSACWLGIATDAVRRARLYVRSQMAHGSGVDRRLADAASLLQEMRASVFQAARTCEGTLDDSASTVGLALEMNQLKLGASELVVRIVGLALSICGMPGYLNDGPYSLGRHLRDAYSAGCMISNEWLREANATMLLLQKAL
jgi:acyl-CoA dehydrogenase